MNFYFDFDGTVVDIKLKYYKIYSAFIKSNNGTILDIDTFWDKKRAMTPNNEITYLSGLNSEIGKNLSNYTKTNIEKEEFLVYDSLINGVLEVFKIIKEKNIGSVFIITMRRNKPNLYNQINSLGLNNFIDDIFLPYTEDNLFDEGDPLAKSIFLNKNGHQNLNSVIIGDSGMDILSGKNLSWKTIAVLSGIRNKENLEKYHPDYILESVNNLIPFLNKFP